MLPVLLQLGPVKIYSMGLMMSLGLVMSLYWWWKMGRDEHWEEISLFDAYFLGVLGVFVMGRIGYVMFAGEISGLWQGLSLLSKPGINYLVGIIGAVIVVSGVARAKEWEIWKVWDTLAVSLSLAVIWGAIGMLLNRGEILLDTWGILMASVSFVVTSIVRKNFRFYSWYKGTNSVAKDGLGALTMLLVFAIYYIGRAVIGKSLVMGGVALLILVGVALIIYQRSGQTQFITKSRRRIKK